MASSPKNEIVRFGGPFLLIGKKIVEMNSINRNFVKNGKFGILGGNWKKWVKFDGYPQYKITAEGLRERKIRTGESE